MPPRTCSSSNARASSGRGSMLRSVRRASAEGFEGGAGARARRDRRWPCRGRKARFRVCRASQREWHDDGEPSENSWARLAGTRRDFRRWRSAARRRRARSDRARFPKIALAEEGDADDGPYAARIVAYRNGERRLRVDRLRAGAHVARGVGLDVADCDCTLALPTRDPPCPYPSERFPSPAPRVVECSRQHAKAALLRRGRARSRRCRRAPRGTSEARFRAPDPSPSTRADGSMLVSPFKARLSVRPACFRRIFARSSSMSSASAFIRVPGSLLRRRASRERRDARVGGRAQGARTAASGVRRCSTRDSSRLGRLS